MDFSTQAGGEPWAHRALQRVLQMKAAHVLASDAAPHRERGAKPATCPTDAATRYPLGMHQHAYPEICLALQGRARMDISNRSYVFAPPHLALLPPGLAHCEAFISSHSYALLWISSMGPNVRTMISRYSPARRWEVAPWIGCNTELGNELADAAAHSQALTDPAAFERLRATLLALLARIHHLHMTSTHATAPAPPARWADSLQRVQRFLDSHLDQPIRIEQLSAMSDLSPNYLNRLFTRWTGHAVHAYLKRRRLKEAHRLLTETDMLAKQVAIRVGYQDPLYFSRAFKEFFGYRPSQARHRG